MVKKPMKTTKSKRVKKKMVPEKGMKVKKTMAVDKVQKEKKIKADRLTAIAVMSELDALFGPKAWMKAKKGHKLICSPEDIHRYIIGRYLVTRGLLPEEDLRYYVMGR